MRTHWTDWPADVLAVLRRGAVIPAHPLALDASRKLDERRQRALSRYYIDAGAGGLAVGVHTTQFAIREAGLYRPVLELAADKAGWSSGPLPKGKGRGIAVCEAFKSYVAQVAEVTVDDAGQVTVDRVVCAVDCGIPINPDVIAAQMEGGIGFGLGAVLYGAITLKNGRVEQDNFNGYRVLRINEMPKVEVHIVPSEAPPTGIGEPGLPPLAPAVSNAIFAATGKRLNSLPWDFKTLKSA